MPCSKPFLNNLAQTLLSGTLETPATETLTLPSPLQIKGVGGQRKCPTLTVQRLGPPPLIVSSNSRLLYLPVFRPSLLALDWERGRKTVDSESAPAVRCSA